MSKAFSPLKRIYQQENRTNLRVIVILQEKSTYLRVLMDAVYKN